mmetsp:Transcript_29714/g.100065  ORF Transcript_29714/g.100065 Transcript_29714/m.100065 type:complete len:381 (+) Transcript_29714:298-1440(+)
MRRGPSKCRKARRFRGRTGHAVPRRRRHRAAAGRRAPAAPLAKRRISEALGSNARIEAPPLPCPRRSFFARRGRCSPRRRRPNVPWSQRRSSRRLRRSSRRRRPCGGRRRRRRGRLRERFAAGRRQGPSRRLQRTQTPASPLRLRGRDAKSPPLNPWKRPIERLWARGGARRRVKSRLLKTPSLPRRRRRRPRTAYIATAAAPCPGRFRPFASCPRALKRRLLGRRCRGKPRVSAPHRAPPRPPHAASGGRLNRRRCSPLRRAGWRSCCAVASRPGTCRRHRLGSKTSSARRDGLRPPTATCPPWRAWCRRAKRRRGGRRGRAAWMRRPRPRGRGYAAPLVKPQSRDPRMHPRVVRRRASSLKRACRASSPGPRASLKGA